MKCKYPHPVLRRSALRKHTDVKVVYEANKILDLLAIEYRETGREEINEIAKRVSELIHLLHDLIHKRYDVIDD